MNMAGAVEMAMTAGRAATADARTVVQRFYEELVNQREFAVAGEIIAGGCAWLPGLALGPDGAVQYVRHLVAQFPDLRVMVDEVIADPRAQRGRVVARVTFSGTYRGLSPELTATSPGAVWPEAAFFHVVDGKIDDLWVAGGTTTVCVARHELWTGVYLNGNLVAQGHRIDEPTWLHLLERAGATCVSETIAGGVPGGRLPPTEAELRDLFARRQATLAAVTAAEEQLRSAERQLAEAQRTLHAAKERASLPV
jgi:predicted ester cyclase